MFHQRIASDLRSHFSTVGPSPRTLDLPVTFSSPSSTANPRPILLPPLLDALPATLPARRDRRFLLEEFVRVSSHRITAFLAEAAVLVLVLGILDRFLASNRFEPRWVGGAFLASFCLLAASIALDLSTRLWLRRTAQKA